MGCNSMSYASFSVLYILLYVLLYLDLNDFLRDKKTIP